MISVTKKVIKSCRKDCSKIKVNVLDMNKGKVLDENQKEVLFTHVWNPKL